MRDVFYPESLSKMQTWFAKIITAPIQEMDGANIPIYPADLHGEIQAWIAPSPTLTSEERIGIYQQQYWWRLLNILQNIFPSLVRLFDCKEFNQRVAEPYLTTYPPNDWFLSSLGDLLPKWIRGHYKEKDAPLVLELAYLDLAYQKLSFAERLDPLKPSDLFLCDKNALYLQPDVSIFELQADLFSFRKELLSHLPSHWQNHPFPHLKKKLAKRYFTLFRHEGGVVYEEISESLFAILNRFRKGAKMVDLVPLLEMCEGLLESFQTMTSRGWLTLHGKEI